jgi:ABC-type branched-subunit amino acid transport system substrate-binding protein
MRVRHPLPWLAVLACAVGLAACGSSSHTTATTTATTPAATTGTATTPAATTGTATAVNNSLPPVKLALISFNVPGSSLLPEFTVAANAAASVINGEGGFGGRRLQIITCNSMLQPAAATDCGHRTISQNPVSMLGCELTWYATGLPLYQAAGVPSINCLNGQADVTNKFSFGLQASAVGEDQALMRWLCTQSDVHTVVSLLPESPQFTTAIEPALTKTLNGCGRKSVPLYYPLTAVDVSPYVVKAIAAKPQFIFLSSIGALVDNFYKAFQQNGWPASKTAVPDTDFIPSVTDPLGSSINGAVVIGQFATANSTATDPNISTFSSSLHGNTTYTYDPNVAWIWAETMFVYDAAKQIGFSKFTPQSFQQWMNTYPSLPIPLSHTFTNPGPTNAPQIKQPYARIERWENGKFVPQTAGPQGDGWINGW